MALPRPNSNDGLLQTLFDELKRATRQGDYQTASMIMTEINRIKSQAYISNPYLNVPVMPQITAFQGGVAPDPSTMTAKSYTLEKGSRVVLKAGTGRDASDRANPIWGNNGNYIAGTIRDMMGGNIMVDWDNGVRNIYYAPDCKIFPLEAVETKKRSKLFNKTNLDTTKLDALIIKPEVKQEIVAVLKQHQNAGKLFDEWGLGEVIEYGRGMTFMFWGNPGTGKTWAAECISKALDKELLTINAGDIQTSEPGGANRNITQAFKTASQKEMVLFLDECDSLITVRDEVGMILSSEINTLLTEIERFEGVCILATNRIGTMDEALERRIALIVEFPEPDYQSRMLIWKRLIPSKMPLSKEVNFEKLAEEKLTGGQIKNAVIQAARLALAAETKNVELEHFTQAIKRIHESRSLMGKGSRSQKARIDYVKG